MSWFVVCGEGRAGLTHYTLFLSQERCQRELSQLEKTIRKKQGELDTILPRFQEHRDEEEQLNVRCAWYMHTRNIVKCGWLALIIVAGCYWLSTSYL